MKLSLSNSYNEPFYFKDSIWFVDVFFHVDSIDYDVTYLS